MKHFVGKHLHFAKDAYKATEKQEPRTNTNLAACARNIAKSVISAFLRSSRCDARTSEAPPSTSFWIPSFLSRPAILPSLTFKLAKD